MRRVAVITVSRHYAFFLQCLYYRLPGKIYIIGHVADGNVLEKFVRRLGTLRLLVLMDTLRLLVLKIDNATLL